MGLTSAIAAFRRSPAKEGAAAAAAATVSTTTTTSAATNGVHDSPPVNDIGGGGRGDGGQIFGKGINSSVCVFAEKKTSAVGFARALLCAHATLILSRCSCPGVCADLLCARCRFEGDKRQKPERMRGRAEITAIKKRKRVEREAIEERLTNEKKNSKTKK